MRITLLTLLGTILLGLVSGCSRPDVEMPENPTPPPKESPGPLSADEPVK